MKKVLIASTNPVKINSVVSGFEMMFPGEKFEIDGVLAESNVSDQPMDDDETYQGAFNRVSNLSNTNEADFWVGLEAGIFEHEGDLGVFGWVVIKSKEGKFGRGRSATFMLPEKIGELVRGGMELGEADDRAFGDSNSKQKEGTVGKLTKGVIDREKMYVEAVAFALIPFKNPELY